MPFFLIVSFNDRKNRKIETKNGVDKKKKENHNEKILLISCKKSYEYHGKRM